jgi:hypothetical protein
LAATITEPTIGKDTFNKIGLASALCAPGARLALTRKCG